jgi:hypothetical protein
MYAYSCHFLGYASMEKIGRRDAFLVVSLIILVSGILFALDVFNLGSVPDDDGLWYIAGPYQWTDNKSYSVLFHGVNFTFLYYIDDGFLDVPLPILIRLAFIDGTNEELSIGVGGWTLSNRINFSEHKTPRAAVFTTDSAVHELHYSWFYAVEM